MLIDDLRSEEVGGEGIEPDAIFDISNVVGLVGDYQFWTGIDFLKLPFERTLMWFEFEGFKCAAYFQELETLHKTIVMFFVSGKNKTAVVSSMVLKVEGGIFVDAESDKKLTDEALLQDICGYISNDIENIMISELVTAINLLHCKNVAPVEIALPDKLVKARSRRDKYHVDKTYVLAIEPKKRKYTTESDEEYEKLAKAFHICRGHRRTYGENSKGLFGRYYGTFWVPAHTRGDKENGKVTKSYKLNHGKR